MNIDYLPQDWRFSFEASDRDGNLKKIDARVSFMPGIITESVVIRFLDATESIDDFREIGFRGDNLSVLENYLHKTSGIIIITGPTGSGKTTTLYAILKKSAHLRILSNTKSQESNNLRSTTTKTTTTKPD